jgi:hypothetical protein
MNPKTRVGRNVTKRGVTRRFDWKKSTHIEQNRRFTLGALDCYSKNHHKERIKRFQPLNLDQGTEGACTGFGMAHVLSSTPRRVHGLTAGIAQGIYHQARREDEWEGEDYDGSSVLAAIKAGKELGWYSEYRWAFGLDDVILAIGYRGPVVLGVNWYTGMMQPDRDWYLRVTGIVEGGHAILANQVNVRDRWVGLRNSWGGACNGRITFDDLDRLLHEQGEAVIPTKRTKPK